MTNHTFYPSVVPTTIVTNEFTTPTPSSFLTMTAQSSFLTVSLLLVLFPSIIAIAICSSAAYHKYVTTRINEYREKKQQRESNIESFINNSKEEIFNPISIDTKKSNKKVIEADDDIDIDDIDEFSINNTSGKSRGSNNDSIDIRRLSATKTSSTWIDNWQEKRKPSSGSKIAYDILMHLLEKGDAYVATENNPLSPRQVNRANRLNRDCSSPCSRSNFNEYHDVFVSDEVNNSNDDYSNEGVGLVVVSPKMIRGVCNHTLQRGYFLTKQQQILSPTHLNMKQHMYNKTNNSTTTDALIRVKNKM